MAIFDWLRGLAPVFTERKLRRILREELSYQRIRELSEDPELSDPEMDVVC